MARFPRLKKKNSTPTRQVTGTSYTAQGADGVKAPSMQELGSAAAAILVDPVPDLSNPITATRTYTKMARDDATIRMSLRAAKAPVLGAEWYVEPYSSDPLDLAIAEFVEFNLFHGTTVQFIKTIEQILTMYETGKSVFEPVWELREWAPKKSSSGANRKQYTMLRKLAYRPSSTLGKVNYDDNGGPVSIDHVAIGAQGQSKEVQLPIEKLVVFTFDQQGGGIEGMSILRSAYKHWWYKNRFYNIDAIQKERHGIGVPDIEVQPGASDNDKKLAHELGQNLRTNEKAYIVRPPTVKVGFAEIKTQPVNSIESIREHDSMILRNVLVEFMNIEGSGGRASAATGMDMMLKSMRHIAMSICGGYNYYLIPNLVAYNFPTSNFPRLGVRGVGEVKDAQMFSAALRNLADTDLITIDEATENWVRNQFDMPGLTTEWVSPSERPEKVQELIQVGGTGGTTPPKAGATSKNGGAGNVGKSESSGAV